MSLSSSNTVNKTSGSSTTMCSFALFSISKGTSTNVSRCMPDSNGSSDSASVEQSTQRESLVAGSHSGSRRPSR